MTQNVNAIATKTARTWVRSLGSGAFIDFLHIVIVPAPEVAIHHGSGESVRWDGEGSDRDGRGLASTLESCVGAGEERVGSNIARFGE
jgi:hypothetical protein